MTDYQQGLVWRVPAGGGPAHVWFTDPQLDGALFGPAGIVMMSDHRTLMLDTSAGGVTSPNSTTGKLYTLGINADGSAGTLHKIYESGAKEAPDGFALAQSGNVYMALVGPQVNQLVEISPTGQELGRISHDGSGGNGDIPFDEPSSVSFDGDRMIVTNDAYFSGDATHFAIFDVFAGEPGAPIYVPAVSGGGAGSATGAKPAKVKLTVKPGKARTGHRTRFRIHTSVPRLHVTFAGRRLHTDAHGNLRVTLRIRRSGRYAVRALDARHHAVARAYVRVSRR